MVGRTETKTNPSPRCARSTASHLALDDMMSDFSMERSASCVPMTYMSCSPGEAGSHGTSEEGGSFPCMFHVPTNSRREASAAPSPFSGPKLVSVPLTGVRDGTGVGSTAGTSCGTAAGTSMACAGVCIAMGTNGMASPASGGVWRGGGDHGEMAGIGESRARTGMEVVDGVRMACFHGGSPGGSGGGCIRAGSAGGSVSLPECCSAALQRAASACALTVRWKCASAEEALVSPLGGVAIGLFVD